MTNASGGVTLAHTFEPYGESLASNGAGDSAYGYTGEWTDATGLVHLRARYYAPYLKQWTQPDPIVAGAYLPADWNRYRYVRSNPGNYTDPSGLCWGADQDGKCDSWERALPRGSGALLAPTPLSGMEIPARYSYCRMEQQAYYAEILLRILEIERKTGLVLGVDTNSASLPRERGWRFLELDAVYRAARYVDSALRKSLDAEQWRRWRDQHAKGQWLMVPHWALFRNTYAGVQLLRGSGDYVKGYEANKWYAKTDTRSGQTILLYGPPDIWGYGESGGSDDQGTQLVLHELGHSLDVISGNAHSTRMANAGTLEGVVGYIEDREAGDPGSKGGATGLSVHQRTGTDQYEIWADLFASWAWGRFPTSGSGAPRAPLWTEFLDTEMPQPALDAAARWACSTWSGELRAPMICSW